MGSNAVYSKIKSIRELKNYTQQYMAEQLELSQPAYNKIESGKTALTIQKLDDIARILEVNMEDIIGFDSTKFINAYDKVKINTTECIYTDKDSIAVIQKLYEDKITLLERLLLKIEEELDFYKNKALIK